MKKLHIKKDDVVVVNSGDAKGRKAKVLAVSPKEGKVIVEGTNMVSKHVKPKKQGEAGGIVQAESAFYACKVNLYCPKCEKGMRVKMKTLKNGEKIRTCAKCGETL